ncbi:MAG: hypothetical protein J0I02_05070, partial [Alphaproteobacteria bacterium]|nr:hypothetical protein [Alphaproteobacteria bacterium]
PIPMGERCDIIEQRAHPQCFAADPADGQIDRRACFMRRWRGRIGRGRGPMAGVYSVFGTAVERAAALTGNADGFAIICDGATAAVASAQFALLPLDMPNDVAGENQRHAVLGDQGMRASPQFRAAATFHARIFDAMAAGEYAAARDLVAQTRRLSGASQSLYDRYDERITAMADTDKNIALKRAG